MGGPTTLHYSRTRDGGLENEFFSRAGLATGPGIHTELERKFALPKSDLAKHGIRLNALSPEQIFDVTQSYLDPSVRFPGSDRSCLELVVGLVAASKNSSFLAELHINQARLRKQVSRAGEATYSLDLKGPYEDRERGMRPEIPFEINDEKLYRSLLPFFVGGGTLEKTRLRVPGHIYGRKDQKHVAFAEIDFLRSAGNPPTRIDYCALSHVFVDVELPHVNLTGSLVLGKHSFEFLKSSGIDLLEQRNGLRRAFSSRRLAAEGFDQRFWRGMKQLGSISAERADDFHRGRIVVPGR